MGSMVFSCMRLTTAKKKLKPQIKSGSFGVFMEFWKQSENEIWLTLCHDLHMFSGGAETVYHDPSEIIPLGVTAKPHGQGSISFYYIFLGSHSRPQRFLLYPPGSISKALRFLAYLNISFFHQYLKFKIYITVNGVVTYIFLA